MKSISYRAVTVGLVAALLSGCVSPAVERHAAYQAACARRFTDLVALKQTTRAEEQEYIAANERAWRFLCEALGIEVKHDDKESRSK